MRTELQALRALSVALIVAEHLRPGRIAAGYVGLEVFFAVSGFLITRLMLKELDASGSISLPAFWARRARRLLPASLLVLLTCAAAARLVTLRSHQHAAFAQVAASGLYSQNWYLSAVTADYWGNHDETPVLHYWSLSLEEQFYLFWPLLVLGAAVLARRRRARPRVAIGAAVAALSALSLAFAFTRPRGDEDAYLSTAVRAWEFGAGGLLALLADAEGLQGLRAAASWAGLAALLGAALLLPPGSYPPSPWTLLTVGATLAVIWAGAPRVRWSPEKLLYRWKPVQALGDLSYSVYLWHYPVIVFLAQARRLPGRALAPVFPALAATLALAWLTKRCVEDPVRHGPLLARRPPRATFAAAAAGMAVVIGAAQALEAGLRRDTAASFKASRALASPPPPCFGAAERDPLHPCVNPALAAVVVPAPIDRDVDWERLRPMRLEDGLEVEELGSDAARARPRAGPPFALIGDSHAMRLRSAFDAVAEDAPGVAVTDCAATARVRRRGCVLWNEKMLAWLNRHPEIETVYLAQRQRPKQRRAEANAFLGEWRRFPQSVRRIVVMRDNPVNLDPDCVERALRAEQDPRACRDPQAEALERDPAVAAAARFGPRAQVLDLTDLICDGVVCGHVIGGVRVFEDQTHLTTLFAATLAPILRRRAGVLARHSAVAGAR